MKLAALLKTHELTQSEIGLKFALGDSYLCHSNRIFRTVRTKAHEFGYKFSHDLNNDYLVLSLAQLENILKSKKIPYYDNVSTLKKLEHHHPNLTEFENIVDNYKFNFHFHESCHAVCREYTSQPQFLKTNPVLLRIIEESFANTCELLGVVDALNETDQIFWLVNSYSSVFEIQDQLIELLKHLSFKDVFEVTLYSYIHSNYLHESISDGQFERLLKLTQVEQSTSPQKLKLLKRLTENCFSLDETFKYISTGYYMKLNYPNLKHDELSKTDWMLEFEKNENLRILVHDLSLLAP